MCRRTDGLERRREGGGDGGVDGEAGGDGGVDRHGLFFLDRIKTRAGAMLLRSQLAFYLFERAGYLCFARIGRLDLCNVSNMLSMYGCMYVKKALFGGVGRITVCE